MKQKRKKRASQILLFIAGMVTTIVGFIIIPTFIDQFGKKLYKASLKSEEIDFDSMGPEIVRKSATESQEGKA